MTRKQLTADDWTDTQTRGDLIREAGHEGLLMPSTVGVYNSMGIFVDRLAGSPRIEFEDVKLVGVSRS